MKNIRPPQPPAIFNETPESVIKWVQQAREELSRLQDSIVGSVTVENATFDNVIHPLAQNGNKLNVKHRLFDLLRSASPDPELRGACTDAIRSMTEVYKDLFSRPEIFALITAIHNRNEEGDDESKIMVKIFRQEFIGRGLEISDKAKHERFLEIEKQLSDNRIAARQNINEDKSHIWLSLDELEGVLPSFVDGLEKDPETGMRRLTLKGPDLGAILGYCKNPEVRKRVFLGHQNICPENVPIFDESIQLRYERAQLLGFANFATQKLRNLMAKTPETVRKFLDDLNSRLRPRALLELEKLSEMKQKDIGSSTEPFFRWDLPYYHRQILEQDYQIDRNEIAEYFPADTAIEGMLNIFEKLFGLVINRVSTDEFDALSPTGKGADIVWHEDVKLFTVWDCDEEGGEFVGYLYMDIHPRDGKYTHAANFPVEPSFIDDNGVRHHPGTSLICNVSSPSPGKPSLLKHGGIVTLFHELGHAMHDLLSRTRYSQLQSWNNQADFGEAPSQLLEYWCWIPELLQSMSCHYSHLSPEYKEAWLKDHPGREQPGKLIPERLVQGLQSIKMLNDALYTLRQVAESTFDIEINGPMSYEECKAIVPTEMYNRYMVNIALLKGPEIESSSYDWGHGHVVTNHFIESNASTYYAYLYTKVFAADLFHSAFEANPMNPVVGRKYRHQILEKGGSQEAITFLTEFLGRTPNAEAFEAEMGFEI